ncbi:hypothetical protein EG346_09440 [Chryseobacterium carnipullorum]|uniref:Uncharacterized protein n=1 Tax=Chryseobacterium carnipullorum TaxID=1124835 RepID=A0A376DPY3_CHRCU|nr:hypothetical protein [Chryseobacterium carnipullorum]AZA48395.1 hypothetical protein EG346_09440 [Chryseobacterium carnipullorum]AZA63327.1 hypothetical protein EG345_00345 [Chryseobacterium carnipullorum]STC92185.1 Uncharacterised protein [Chryseobacterium carnipullorum]
MKTATTHTPGHYGMIYTLDEVKKSFRQYKLSNYEKIAFSELIRTEKNNGYNSSTGAENLFKIRNTTNWSKCTITGLRPTATPNFYYADLPIKDKKSLFVVFIPEDWEMIYIRICPQFYPFNRTDRFSTVNEIIKVMLNHMNEKGNE